jgi:hypothetical protein
MSQLHTSSSSNPYLNIINEYLGTFSPYPLQLRTLANKGNSLFTTTAIPAAQLIFTDKSYVLGSKLDYKEAEGSAAHLEAEYQLTLQLLRSIADNETSNKINIAILHLLYSPQECTQFTELPSTINKQANITLLQSTLSIISQFYGANSISEGPATGKYFIDIYSLFSHCYSAISLNSWRDSLTNQLICSPLIAYINHSCAPNSIRSASSFSVHSSQELAADSEISINYFPGELFFYPSAERNEVLEHWKFRCDCPRCVNNLHDDKIVTNSALNPVIIGNSAATRKLSSAEITLWNSVLAKWTETLKFLTIGQFLDENSGEISPNLQSLVGKVLASVGTILLPNHWLIYLCRRVFIELFSSNSTTISANSALLQQYSQFIHYILAQNQLYVPRLHIYKQQILHNFLRVLATKLKIPAKPFYTAHFSANDPDFALNSENFTELDRIHGRQCCNFTENCENYCVVGENFYICAHCGVYTYCSERCSTGNQRQHGEICSGTEISLLKSQQDSAEAKKAAPSSGGEQKRAKIKPNEPCSCKSGKKYKKCCGRRE